MQFLHGDIIFVENLKHGRGKYTEKQVERCSYLTGNVVQSLDRAFANNLGEVDVLDYGRGKDKKVEEVASFVEEYREDQLFSKMPGRAHAHFPHFRASAVHQKIKQPARLKERLFLYSQKLDRARYASSLEVERPLI